MEKDFVGVDDDNSKDYPKLMSDLFHVTALQVLSPLEFKEVKMLSVEILGKLPVRRVIPFVLSHLIAFAHCTAPEVVAQAKQLSFSGESETIMPQKSLLDVIIPRRSSGVVAAKLLVYYLNRALSEGLLVCDGEEDSQVMSTALSVLCVILLLPSGNDGPNVSPLADLQLGCIDWMAQLLTLSTASVPTIISVQDCERLIDQLAEWLRTGKPMINQSPPVSSSSTLAASACTKMMKLVSQPPDDQLALQFRICCCNVLLR